MISKFLKSSTNIARSNFIWNVIAGGVNALEAVILLMVVTRVDGVEAAGILTIAFAIGNLFMTIGKYGVRTFQSTDVEREFSFNTYCTFRATSCIMMFVISLGYTFLKYCTGIYTFQKGMIVLGICLIYVVESFEDVFLGQYQLIGRLDIGSKVFILRWMIIIITFVIVDVFLNLLGAVWIALIASIIFDIYLLKIANLITKIKWGFQKSQIKKIIIQCTPLFFSTFLTYYVTNAPKYAIDQYMSQEVQAYFGYISMPIFIVELLNCFLYQPLIVSMAKFWQDKNLKALNRGIIKQLIVITGLTIVCILGTYFCGIPILQFIYGVELFQYKLELIVLMTAGGMLAYVGYSGTLLTIMRKQKILLINMVVITIFALVGFGVIVQKWGLMGVSLYYLTLMFLLAIINYACIVVIEKKNKHIHIMEA